MHGEYIMKIALLFAILWLCINVIVTRAVLRRDESSHLKRMLIAGVWLVPFVGAFMAFDFGGRSSTLAKRALPDGFQTDAAPRTISTSRDRKSVV